MKEIEIKKLLVKHVLSLYKDVTVGAEVPFNYGSRRADVISIHNGMATAYEIKGAGDTIERLSYQIKSYKDYFDFCFIVCEKSNLQQIRKVVGQSGYLSRQLKALHSYVNQSFLSATTKSHWQAP